MTCGRRAPDSGGSRRAKEGAQFCRAAQQGQDLRLHKRPFDRVSLDSPEPRQGFRRAVLREWSVQPSEGTWNVNTHSPADRSRRACPDLGCPFFHAQRRRLRVGGVPPPVGRRFADPVAPDMCAGTRRLVTTAAPGSSTSGPAGCAATKANRRSVLRLNWATSLRVFETGRSGEEGLFPLNLGMKLNKARCSSLFPRANVSTSVARHRYGGLGANNVSAQMSRSVTSRGRSHVVGDP
jgi:hypothetical protein